MGHFVMGKYDFFEFFNNILFFIRTKLFFKNSRLIRFPIYIRNKKSIKFGTGLTTGYSCRFDLGDKKNSLIFGNDVRLGDRVHIVAVESVKIGNDCLFASNIFVSDCDHGFYKDGCTDILIHPKDRPLYILPVIIGSDCWIGDNVCILKGSKIGHNCIIGANSVVSGVIPDYSIAVGQPAKVIKHFNPETKQWEKVKTDDKKE